MHKSIDPVARLDRWRRLCRWVFVGVVVLVSVLVAGAPPFLGGSGGWGASQFVKIDGRWGVIWPVTYQSHANDLFGVPIRTNLQMSLVDLTDGTAVRVERIGAPHQFELAAPLQGKSNVVITFTSPALTDPIRDSPHARGASSMIYNWSADGTTLIDPRRGYPIVIGRWTNWPVVARGAIQRLVIGSPLVLLGVGLAMFLTSRKLWYAARRGRCPACGYDVRSSMGRCPECGAALVAEVRRADLATADQAETDERSTHA